MNENFEKSTPEYLPERDVIISQEVRHALDSGNPVVALDTTIFGQSGLGSEWPEGNPSEIEGGPNEACLGNVLTQLSAREAVPALTAVLNGEVRVGIDEADYSAFLLATEKAGVDHMDRAVRDHLTATTTISSALMLAEHSGIKVLATSGIGGIHVDHSDRSSDLDALAQYSVITVAAGMKTFLDRQATLEALNLLDVPVLGWRTNDCPAFYSRSTGLEIQGVESAEEVYSLAQEKWEKSAGGILLAVPIPEAFDIPLAEIQEVIDEANADIAARGIVGPSVTPEVLKFMRAKLGNRLVLSNLALAQENARVAAEVAQEFSRK